MKIFFLNELKIALIIIVCFFPACRYEDGPAISLRSAENRLKGEYAIFKFEKGGIDLTDSLKKMMCYNKFIIHKGSVFEARENICGCDGTYDLSQNNTKIVFGFYHPDTLIEPLGARFADFYWDIVRLTDDEIHLTGTYNNQFIQWNLKQ
ncbi:MAG TPA: hypothetical protein PKD91_06700 [Bacteroidia bacterium]|nr:hypothetical protein [Bacteroidia bacterium]